MDGLAPGKVYNARAYGKTFNGLHHGDAVWFVTTNRVADSQGNVHKRMRIGQQEGMSEYLRTTEYNRAEPILYFLATWNGTTRALWP
jgi:hypothetical protein